MKRPFGRWTTPVWGLTNYSLYIVINHLLNGMIFKISDITRSGHITAAHAPTAQIKVCTLSFCVVWSNHPIYLYMAWICMVWSNTTMYGMVYNHPIWHAFLVRYVILWGANPLPFLASFFSCHSGRLLAWTQIREETSSVVIQSPLLAQSWSSPSYYCWWRKSCTSWG